jgi:hypothetical protein
VTPTERRQTYWARVDQLLDIRIQLYDLVILLTERFAMGVSSKEQTRLGGKIQGVHSSIAAIDEALRNA